MSEKAMRPWCAMMQYDGKAKFIVGTFLCANGDPQHDIESRLWNLVDSLLPTRPTLIELISGSIFFIPESEAERTVSI